jgi:hypothetical protein
LKTQTDASLAPRRLNSRLKKIPQKGFAEATALRREGSRSLQKNRSDSFADARALCWLTFPLKLKR